MTNDFLTERLQNTDKPIVLYGMGDGADKIADTLESRGIEISGVFVSDGFVRDKIFRGHKLCSYADMKARFGEMVVLVCFGTSLPDVIENIERIAREQELYAPYVPVIGEGCFDRKYVNAHKNSFASTLSFLSDDLSRKTFTSILNYRASGSIPFLCDCETTTDELYSLLKLNDNEVYADLGAYRGDTVAEFIAHTGGFRAIHAVEPDPKTYKKLAENTDGLPNISLYNAAAYSHSRGVAFSARSGRNSSIERGNKEIPSVCIDEICHDATYIKMDIEGAELDAIQGARETILKNKPKMRIACYHRIDDLFAIPQAVLDIRDDYKVYMRHRPYVPDWDTEILFI